MQNEDIKGMIFGVLFEELQVTFDHLSEDDIIENINSSNLIVSQNINYNDDQ